MRVDTVCTGHLWCLEWVECPVLSFTSLSASHQCEEIKATVIRHGETLRRTKEEINDEFCLVAASGDSSLIAVHGLSSRWVLLLQL